MNGGILNDSRIKAETLVPCRNLIRISPDNNNLFYKKKPVNIINKER